MNCLEGEDSASESLSILTRSVVELVFDVEPAGVPLSVDRVPYFVVSGSLFAQVYALWPAVEQLRVASLSPVPVGVCLGSTANVVEDGVTAAGSPVVVAVQTKGGLCVLKNSSIM